MHQRTTSVKPRIFLPVRVSPHKPRPHVPTFRVPVGSNISRGQTKTVKSRSFRREYEAYVPDDAELVGTVNRFVDSNVQSIAQGYFRTKDKKCGLVQLVQTHREVSK